MIATTAIRERALLPQSDHHHTYCNRSWPDRVTVDISRLLKAKEAEEEGGVRKQSTTTPVGSPTLVSASRSGHAPASIATGSTTGRLLPNSLNTTASTSTVIPAKRGAKPVDYLSSESPAKKQSKWSPEEDAKIIQLRGDGMKWEDISKHLPGRSAISCRLHYQNYLERRSEWDEDRKNKLARLYERFKADMWARIAEEMAIPWRAAEAMHWQMGETEMAKRAGVTPFSLTTTSNTAPPIMAAGSRPHHHMRSNSAAPRLRRDSHPHMILPPQLPSLAELTASLNAPSPHHPLNHHRFSSSALTPPPLYHHINTFPLPPQIGNQPPPSR